MYALRLLAHLASGCEDAQRGHLALQGDEAPAGGVELAVQRLQAVAAAKSGRPEELVALFVAAMRAHGLLARSVRHGYFANNLFLNIHCEKFRGCSPTQYGLYTL